MTEKEKMLRGDLYMASDPVLSAEHIRAVKLWRIFNSLPPDDNQRMIAVLKEYVLTREIIYLSQLLFIVITDIIFTLGTMSISIIIAPFSMYAG